MLLNQSQPESIDTPKLQKGVSASESFSRGHLDNSPWGVWEGCKYKWQLPPPSGLLQPSRLHFSSSPLFKGKNPAQSKGKALLARKFLFLFAVTLCSVYLWTWVFRVKHLASRVNHYMLFFVMTLVFWANGESRQNYVTKADEYWTHISLNSTWANPVTHTLIHPLLLILSPVPCRR